MNTCPLTTGRVSGKLAVPKSYEWRNKRLSVLPRNGKSLVRISAAEAPAVSGWLLSHIGGVQRPDAVRPRQSLVGLGSVATLPFFVFSIPKFYEVPMADKTFQTPTGESPQLVRCKDCAHLLPVNEHRRKARCVWTGERLDAGEVERARECFGFEEKAGEDLTSAGVSGMVGFPKSVRGVAIAVSSSPTVKKVLPAYSAVEALTISSGRLSYIGGIITSRTREGLAVSDRLGSVVIPPLLFNPKLSEVPHA